MERLPDASEFKTKVLAAYERIRDRIVRTPLEPSDSLSRLTGVDISVKWECAQQTGSFKLRGALNRIRTLSPGERSAGIVAASTGNHGLAVAWAAAQEGIGAEVYVPSGASSEKLRRLRNSGVKFNLVDGPCDEAERIAREAGEGSGRVFLSPYNDLEVIFGQGTIGVELLETSDPPDIVLIPVGGGGLAAGVAGYCKAVRPQIRVFGVEPESSCFMSASFKAGRLVDLVEGETLADAVAGGIEPESVTYPLCRKLLDGILTVTEPGLRSALRDMVRSEGRTVEGAGALPLACVEEHADFFRGKKTTLLASGGNIDRLQLERILSE